MLMDTLALGDEECLEISVAARLTKCGTHQAKPSSVDSDQGATEDEMTKKVRGREECANFTLFCPFIIIMIIIIAVVGLVAYVQDESKKFQRESKLLQFSSFSESREVDPFQLTARTTKSLQYLIRYQPQSRHFLIIIFYRLCFYSRFQLISFCFVLM
jgi:hypothetical protein